MTPPGPDAHAFILGAMKSGTTTLFAYLAQHPQIAAHPMKEPELFSRRTAPGAAALAGYAAGWETALAGRIALEASTGYTKRPRFPDAASRIAALGGAKSFLYIVRDPVARIESHVAHNIAHGRAAPATAAALDHPVAVSSYAYQLDAYAAAFPGIPVHVVEMDDLAADPGPTLAGICRALGIDPGFSFAPLPAQNVRGDRVAYRLPTGMAEALRSRLAPDMGRFADLYGIDVGRWGF